MSTAVTQHAGGQSHTALTQSDGVCVCEYVRFYLENHLLLNEVIPLSA